MGGVDHNALSWTSSLTFLSHSWPSATHHIDAEYGVVSFHRDATPVCLSVAMEEMSTSCAINLSRHCRNPSFLIATDEPVSVHCTKL